MTSAKGFVRAKLLRLGRMISLCVFLTTGTTPRIGQISLGKQDPNDSSATARFDYFRVY